ncbi:small multidrug efflux protein [Leucobacter insecticola]|uniref:Small multidrug efflux protein n=1 Tax=Leucobacter insecticola TaxID=2714934 RepID=A0A6G8FHJ9_9MICO|nr:small multidrug efflux protein [Leucobacter insecticola]QIM15831.1 small multidrug efflux protein [Leucobacter insecticola]
MTLIDTFQDLLGQVHELVQPLIIGAAGAVPYVEGHGGAIIGLAGGMNAVVATAAAIVGNFICVAVLVMLGSRARAAVLAREGARGDLEVPRKTPSARRQKFQRAFERYGVPGVSLLGPLLLPTQVTATMLAASGVTRSRILIWQAVAIVGWTVITAAVFSGILTAVS